MIFCEEEEKYPAEEIKRGFGSTSGINRPSTSVLGSTYNFIFLLILRMIPPLKQITEQYEKTKTKTTQNKKSNETIESTTEWEQMFIFRRQQPYSGVIRSRGEFLLKENIRARYFSSVSPIKYHFLRIQDFALCLSSS